MINLRLHGQRLALGAIISASLFLAACGGSGASGGPIGALQNWMTAYSKFDAKAVTDLTCATQKDAVNAELAFFGTTSGTDLSSLQKLVVFDFSKLIFEEKSNDNKTAAVHISGKLLMQLFGQDQNQDMNIDVPVVTEGGQWKVCGNPLVK